MIDVNVVREGTRWTYLRREVEVDEVSARFVVFRVPNGIAEVAPLPKFLAGAKDPAAAEHDSLLERFGSWSENEPAPNGALLCQAISYLLARLGPPAPLNVVPPAPLKSEPTVLPAEPDAEPEIYAADDFTARIEADVDRQMKSLPEIKRRKSAWS